MKKIITTLAPTVVLGLGASPAQARIGACWTYSGHSSGYTISTEPLHLCKVTLPLTLTTTRSGDLVTPAGRSTLFFLKLRAGQHVHMTMQLLAPAAQTVGVESTLELDRAMFDPWLTLGTPHGLVRVHAIGYFTSAAPGFKLVGTRGRQVCVDGTDPFSSPSSPWPTAPWCALTQNAGYGYATRAGYYLLNGTDGGTYSQKGHPALPRNRTVRVTLR